MTLEEATAAFEAHFIVHPCEPGPYAPTGEPHACYHLGFKLARSAPTPTEKEAELIESWFKEACAYAFGKGDHLYWRVRPEMARAPLRSRGRPMDKVHLYGRLCVSQFGPNDARKAT